MSNNFAQKEIYLHSINELNASKMRSYSPFFAYFFYYYFGKSGRAAIAFMR